MNGDEASENQEEFKYVLGEKDEVLIVLLCGKLGSRQVPTLEACEAELKEKEQRFVIVSFRDLNGIAPGVYAPLARFQKSIRDKEKTLAIVGLKPEVRNQLYSNGIIRESEIFGNVHEAWQAISGRKSRV